MNQINRTQENQYVAFKLKDEYYGLDIYSVKSIERISSFTRVPNAPDYVKGVMNLRGEVVPVIDLRIRLGIDSKEIDKESRIVIVNYDESVVGLLVDASSEVIRIEENEIDHVPTMGDSYTKNYISGIGKKDGRLIMILDLEKVLEFKGRIKNES
ncbi:chemotaxis protein CheW [Caldisalinibacter kiritimatiensis]|uniref:Chemotaxis protein CheW n=1 Tax=Caldisalinibacter kiritimatiensis TaxID=1304284 RepID=R1CBN2_9FIRM|nr:chemotaxis protein CheW [Caldisalinibacter kiritimatiensis]EOC99729.1 Positive regulator of CheA protein activity (CheW) [Caldisalinibacter kiritimatiensis]